MKVASATEYSIDKVDLEHASDDELRPFVDSAGLRSREEIPEDPVPPFEALAARFRMTSPMFVRQRWALWSAPGKIAATLSVNRSTTDNLNIREVAIEVHPEHRRRGLGKKLLAGATTESGEGQGLTPSHGQRRHGGPGDQHDAARGTADGRLEDHIRNAARVGTDDPRAGQEHRMAVVIEESTNASAAFTDVFFDPRVPSMIHQGGKKLPQARYIRTDNAGTNAAMLAINVAMGFKPVWESVIWQIPLEGARRYVR